MGRVGQMRAYAKAGQEDVVDESSELLALEVDRSLDGVADLFEYVVHVDLDRVLMELFLSEARGQLLEEESALVHTELAAAV